MILQVTLRFRHGTRSDVSLQGTRNFKRKGTIGFGGGGVGGRKWGGTGDKHPMGGRFKLILAFPKKWQDWGPQKHAHGGEKGLRR